MIVCDDLVNQMAGVMRVKTRIGMIRVKMKPSNKGEMIM